MANVTVTQKDSILDQLEQVRHRIEKRAHDLFRHREGVAGDALADWLTAEREMLWKPAIELRETDGIFTVLVALAGVEPKDVRVDVTAEDVVIKGQTAHTHSTTEGQVHYSEFTAGELFRSMPFPRRVDPAKARAEYRNGLLTITVPAQDAQLKPVKIKAA
jgi:HSP20 family protein